MKMNPNAINLWIIGAAVGFAAHGDIRGAALGLAICSSITFLVSMFGK